MVDASSLLAPFFGRDPVAGARALRELVSLGDAGEELLFGGPIRYNQFAQAPRRWLPYVASRSSSIAPRLLERFADQQRFGGAYAAAYLCAGLTSTAPF